MKSDFFDSKAVVSSIESNASGLEIRRSGGELRVGLRDFLVLAASFFFLVAYIF